MKKFTVQEMVDSLKIGKPKQVEAPDEKAAAESVAGDELSPKGTADQLRARVRPDSEEAGPSEFYDPALPTGSAEPDGSGDGSHMPGDPALRKAPSE